MDHGAETGAGAGPVRADGGRLVGPGRGLRAQDALRRQGGKGEKGLGWQEEGLQQQRVDEQNDTRPAPAPCPARVKPERRRAHGRGARGGFGDEAPATPSPAFARRASSRVEGTRLRSLVPSAS